MPMPPHMTALTPPRRLASTASSVSTAAQTSETPLAKPKTVRARPNTSVSAAKAEITSAAAPTMLLTSTRARTRPINSGAISAPAIYPPKLMALMVPYSV